VGGAVAAERYRAEGVPLIVIGGSDYGAGSSRDWAAKGTRLLGVRAVIARGFERIHRSNLIDMGVLPYQLPEGASAQTLGLDGTEQFGIEAGAKKAFNKPASQLSAGEAALLAAILPNPKRRSAMQPRPGVRRIAGIVQGRAVRSKSIDACLKR